MKVLCITTAVIPTLISAQIRRRLYTQRESIGLVPLKTAYDLIELLSPRLIPSKRFRPASAMRQNNKIEKKKMETTRESVAEDIANAITTWETYD